MGGRVGRGSRREEKCWAKERRWVILLFYVYIHRNYFWGGGGGVLVGWSSCHVFVAKPPPPRLRRIAQPCHQSKIEKLTICPFVTRASERDGASQRVGLGGSGGEEEVEGVFKFPFDRTGNSLIH